MPWGDFTDYKSILVKAMNGLVPSGNKLLPEPMLTQVYATICYHQAPMN